MAARVAGVLAEQICGAGPYSANLLSCELCAVGAYCGQGVQAGTSCGAKMTTLAPGAARQDECVCKIGFVYMPGPTRAPQPHGAHGTRARRGTNAGPDGVDYSHKQ